MKIFIASDSYKGCMSSYQANCQMEKGILRADPSADVETFPISDGGEGMVEAFVHACHGKVLHFNGVDLYRNPVYASYGIDEEEKILCIEAASTLGLTLVPREDRHPMDASSYGLGLMLRELIEKHHPRKVIIGLGGTGTNDGGMGILEAFGAIFYNRFRQPIQACAANLGKVAFIDKRNFHFDHSVELIAACDVRNYLLGPRGAAFTFGKQKGFSLREMEWLEEGMRRFAAKITQTFHRNMAANPGSGAAGGIGGMLESVFHARHASGLELLFEIGHLQEKIARADLIFTGEGQTDLQTLYGKVVFGIAREAKKTGTPVICVSGALGVGYEQLYEEGVSAIFSTANRAMSFSTALKQGPERLEEASCNIMKLIQAVYGMSKRHEIRIPKKENEEADSDSDLPSDSVLENSELISYTNSSRSGQVDADAFDDALFSSEKESSGKTGKPSAADTEEKRQEV